MSESSSNRLPLIIILALLIALVAYLQWPSAPTAKKQYKRMLAVKTVQVEKAEFKDTIEAIGTARANEQVLITSKYSDLVDQVLFNDGQQVKKNDVLVRLNSLEEAAKIKELQANLAESVAQLNRYQDLLKNKATSSSQVDQQEAKTKAIAAQLQSAKSKHSDLTIKAPFDGVLGFRQISVGALVDSGDVITSLDDISIIKVDFNVPERYLPTVVIGQKIAAYTDAYPNKTFEGQVVSIDSRIDEVTRTLKIRAQIPNVEHLIKPGQLLNVIVELDVYQVMQLPESAIIPIEDKHYVYVVEDEIATKAAIEIGRRKPGWVEVLSGLTVDQQVVVEGALKLRDGSSVKVVE